MFVVNLGGHHFVMDHTLECIKEIPDFISEDDINILINYIDANKNNNKKFRKSNRRDRWDSQPPENHDIKEHAEIIHILKKYYEKFIDEALSFYSIKEEIFPYAIWISVMGPQTMLGPHPDNHKGAEAISLSGVIYLNDNFSGGELCFPELSYCYKPKRGSLVIFPSPYIHEIKEIISGFRYAIPVWGTKTKNKSRLSFD